MLTSTVSYIASDITIIVNELSRVKFSKWERNRLKRNLNEYNILTL